MIYNMFCYVNLHEKFNGIITIRKYEYINIQLNNLFFKLFFSIAGISYFIFVILLNIN